MSSNRAASDDRTQAESQVREHIEQLGLTFRLQELRVPEDAWPTLLELTTRAAAVVRRDVSRDDMLSGQYLFLESVLTSPSPEGYIWVQTLERPYWIGKSGRRHLHAVEEILTDLLTAQRRIERGMR